MRLTTKLIVLCAGISAAITAFVGAILYHNLRQDRLRFIEQNASQQLQLIELSLSAFIAEVKSDLRAIAANDWVRWRQAAPGTSKNRSILTPSWSRLSYTSAKLASQGGEDHAPHSSR